MLLTPLPLSILNLSWAGMATGAGLATLPEARTLLLRMQSTLAVGHMISVMMPMAWIGAVVI